MKMASSHLCPLGLLGKRHQKLRGCAPVTVEETGGFCVRTEGPREAPAFGQDVPGHSPTAGWEPRGD